jgi:hypothetical protein
MSVRKPEALQRARSLREKGWALRPIANEVGAALSTVSLWVRDIQPAVAAIETAPAPEVTSNGEVEDALARRRCGTCLRDLPLTSFNRHPTGHQWRCRDCYQAYFRMRAEHHRHQVRSARCRRRQAARAFVYEYLRTHPCSDCGEGDVRILEFDHFEAKRENVTTLMRAGTSVTALQREIGKCTIVCVNCHRVRTAARGASWRLDPATLDSDPQFTIGERRNMIYLRELLMGSRCIDCGDSRLVVLEFDHVGTKTGNVTELARRGCRLRRLEAEVASCEIRCANCHRLRTLGSVCVDGAPAQNHEIAVYEK